MIFFPIIKLAMCIKKFRILIFVLSPVYMIGKTAADSFCIKIFFLQIGPLLILKSIYKIYNDWYMYYQFISFLFWQQYRRAKFPSIVVPVGNKHLISESLVILSCHIISLSCSFVVPGAVLETSNGLQCFLLYSMVPATLHGSEIWVLSGNP